MEREDIYPLHMGRVPVRLHLGGTTSVVHCKWQSSDEEELLVNVKVTFILGLIVLAMSTIFLIGCAPKRPPMGELVDAVVMRYNMPENQILKYETTSLEPTQEDLSQEIT